MKRNIFLLMVMLVALGAQAQTKYTNSGYTVATNILTIPQDQLTPGAAGGLKYDRIETVRNIPTGVLTAFAVPATVDGYFFGADAERYEVKRVEGQTIYVKVMEDEADFESGKLYVVRPELGADRLYSYTAGMLTAVGNAQRDLECYPVDLRDVTRDKKVDVADVTAMVDIILGKDPEKKFDHQVADANGDGVIDVVDVTLLVNSILTGNYKLLVVEE